MKKYVVFISSFALFFFIFQMISGWIVTALHTPDFSSMNGGLSQTVEFGNSSVIPFISTLLVASLAYFVAQVLFKKSYNHN